MSATEREAGRALRAKLPRSALGELALPDDRDPIAVLAAQHESRLADLVPVRVGRMAQSPFTYYRGTAAVMASDLRGAANTGQMVVACGDAHVSNFGFYASPERSLLFDLNDFDEAGLAPWEWDLKRLAASVHVGGRETGLSEADCRAAAERSVRAYAETLGVMVELSALERFYFSVDSSTVAAALDSRATRKAIAKARTRTSDQLLGRLAVRNDSDGSLRIVDQPPIARHVDHASFEQLGDLFFQYRSTLREDVAYLLEGFELADYVLRVVGVGSVGTRCYVLALEGPHREVLFIQAKEAQPSVLTSHGGMPARIPGRRPYTELSEGHRVVACQRILQSHSDPFLGHVVGWAGEQEDRPRVDYYLRQFRDMKGSIDPAVLGHSQFPAYGELCGRLLARAHAQSPAAGTISAYVGKGGRLAEAVGAWAAAYADVCEADHAALLRAIETGVLPAEFDT